MGSHDSKQGSIPANGSRALGATVLKVGWISETVVQGLTSESFFSMCGIMFSIYMSPKA